MICLKEKYTKKKKTKKDKQHESMKERKMHMHESMIPKADKKSSKKVLL